MRRIILLGLLLTIGLAAVAQSLKVASYNIRFAKSSDAKQGNEWAARAPALCSMINYEAWDAFGAQEVLHGQLQFLVDHLKDYAYVGVGRDDGAQAGEYAPIFYKKSRLNCLRSGTFWLSETPDVVGSRGWDAALCRICTWAEFEDRSSKWRFWMFNLHMDHIGVEARKESAKLVLAKVKEMCADASVVLTGDFNVDQYSDSYALLAAPGAFRDAFHASKQNMAETGTFNGFNPNAHSDKRIDHIFVSSRFAVHKYGILTHNYWREMDDVAGGGKKVLARLLSDHYPVVAELELPRLRAPQDWAQYGVYEKANAEVKKAKVVFMGNSITWNWKRFHPEFFSENEGYICRGISGQVTAQMLARFRADVINLHPEKVVILAGTNDIAMNQGYVSLDHVFEHIVSMAELARCNDIDVVLCSVLPADRYRWSWEVDSERTVASIKELNDKLRAYAKQHKLPYADFYSVMADENLALKKEYQQDAVHPNKAGYLVMEDVIQRILKKSKK